MRTNFWIRASQFECHSGDLIGSKYKEEISKLQTHFVRAKESFDRSVLLEVFATIDEIGQHAFVYLLPSLH